MPDRIARRPSLFRFHTRLGSLAAEIEILENRAAANGWDRLAHELSDAKKAVMSAERAAGQMATEQERKK